MSDRTDPCVGCGQCCRGLTIIVNGEDVLREPAIEAAATRMDDDGKLTGEDVKFCLAPQTKNGTTTSDCPFLHDDKCIIYLSRPRLCVLFRRGCSLCTRVRLRAGLGPLPGAAPPD